MPKKINPNKNFISFLYIGRFDYIHGIDIMLKAFDKINISNWTLDMAGGYGKNKDEILLWIDNNKNSKFIGKVDNNLVRETMSKYDVVIVPSRADGWNCQINEALSVGTPIITTKESISFELVENSGAGIVIKNLNSNDLAMAIEKVINSQNLIYEWSKKALAYKNLYSPRIVGEYLYDILNNVFYNGNRPSCPWITSKK